MPTNETAVLHPGWAPGRSLHSHWRVCCVCCQQTVVVQKRRRCLWPIRAVSLTPPALSPSVLLCHVIHCTDVAIGWNICVVTMCTKGPAVVCVYSKGCLTILTWTYFTFPEWDPNIYMIKCATGDITCDVTTSLLSVEQVLAYPFMCRGLTRKDGDHPSKTASPSYHWVLADLTELSLFSSAFSLCAKLS